MSRGENAFEPMKVAHELRDLSKMAKSLRELLRAKGLTALMMWLWEIGVALAVLVIAAVMSGKGWMLLREPLIAIVAVILNLIAVRLADEGGLSWLNRQRLRYVQQLQGNSMGESFLMGLMEEGLLEDVPPDLNEADLKALMRRYNLQTLKCWVIAVILLLASVAIVFIRWS